MDRLSADLAEAARFGATPGGGVTRAAWSAELHAVSEWLCGRLEAEGLAASIDPAGNVIGRWESGTGPAVVVGSHLDTVPDGGRYDGALGVLAGLEAVRLLRERGVEPARPVWVVSFMDEEGTRFHAGLFGSQAFCGDDLSYLAERTDRDGITLARAMADRGFAFDGVPRARAIDQVGAYLELHIEQGPVLERAGVDIGVVTAIVGLIGMRVRLTGEANHAGTTPMGARHDALAGAARAVLGLRDAARDRPWMTANVGVIGVEPAGANVIPGACEFTVDVRAATREGFDELEGIVRSLLEAIAAEEGLGLEILETHRLEPLEMAPAIREEIERAASLEGASTVAMPSGAGHDAMMVGRHVPAGMIFVRSRGGISHSPEEFSEPGACMLGAAVLSRVIEALVT